MSSHGTTSPHLGDSENRRVFPLGEEIHELFQSLRMGDDSDSGPTTHGWPRSITCQNHDIHRLIDDGLGQRPAIEQGQVGGGHDGVNS